METNDHRGRAFLKLVIPLVILVGVIFLFRSGYRAGSWLYQMIHS